MHLHPADLVAPAPRFSPVLAAGASAVAPDPDDLAPLEEEEDSDGEDEYDEEEDDVYEDEFEEENGLDPAGALDDE